LENVLKSHRVVYSDFKDCPYYLPSKPDIINGNFPLKDEDFSFWRRMYEICPLNEEIISYAKNVREKIFPSDGKKVLGVSFRRQFERLHYYQLSWLKAGTHLIRATLTDVISIIKEKMVEWNYEYFFFTVDDREALEAIKKEFGAACLYNERPLIHNFKNGIPVRLDDIEESCKEFGRRQNDVYLRGKEYLTDVYLLSCCDSLISLGSSADFFAYIMNNRKYKHILQNNGKGDTEYHSL
jgi:hypothetical protein